YRMQNDNYVQDTQNNTLGRYIMVSLTYRFGNFGGQRGGMRGPGGPGPGFRPGGPGPGFRPGGPGFHRAPPPHRFGPPGPGPRRFGPPGPPPRRWGPPGPPPRHHYYGHRHHHHDDALAVGGAMFLLGAILAGSSY
ncbi:MAG: hypothetical protein IJ233_02225, partial [Pyramidobacter sp.]|nr:hypothetical protein [Pyramidobacter sp.]